MLSRQSTIWVTLPIGILLGSLNDDGTFFLSWIDKSQNISVSVRSVLVLEEVKSILEKNPDITKLSVEGHTDNVGRDKYNQRLSQQRTESVMKWLTQNGIDRKRLSATGYGSSMPIADNDTAEGREKNRRVEFHIREQIKSESEEVQ